MANNENSPQVATILHSCFPNPFNPKATISFNIPYDDHVEIAVFNLKGQKVKTLLSEFRANGSHSIIWSGTDESGKLSSSGIFFYKIKTSKHIASGKIILLK